MLSSSLIALEGAMEAYALGDALCCQHAEQQVTTTLSGTVSDSADGAPATMWAPLRFVYTLHSSNRKPRQAYLSALFGLLSPEQYDELELSQWESTLRRCEWVAHCIGSMPYEKEGDVLLVIYHANRLLSLHAEPKLAAAARCLGDELDREGRFTASQSVLEYAAASALAGDWPTTQRQPSDECMSNNDGPGGSFCLISYGEGNREGGDCHGWHRSRGTAGQPPAYGEGVGLAVDLTRACHSAALVGLTCVLKAYLKRVYCLSEHRCQSFVADDGIMQYERTITKAVDSNPMQTAKMWSALPEQLPNPPRKSNSRNSIRSGDEDARTDLGTMEKGKSNAQAARLDDQASATTIQIPNEARLAVAQYLWLRSWRIEWRE